MFARGKRRGFAHVCHWNYSPLLTDIARGAADLGAHIERICEQTGHDRVHVVGHGDTDTCSDTHGGTDVETDATADAGRDAAANSAPDVDAVSP